MNKIVIYSPGAFQKYGHSFDYSKGLAESFIELGYDVTIFGMSGPLSFQKKINVHKIDLADGLKAKHTLLQKIKWGFIRIKNYQRLSEEFKNYYQSLQNKPLVIFETFEYFSLGFNIKPFANNYLCVFHDTNFNFKQTSLLAGIYKFLCRIPSRIILKNSKQAFVHGEKMKSNLVSQMGSKYQKKISVIPYGAPTPRVTSIAPDKKSKQTLGLNLEARYLLSFGTLRSDKEYLPVVEVLKTKKNWGWIIAGPEGDYSYKQLEKLALDNGITDKIHTFPKFIQNHEQQNYFMASDLVINLYKPFIRHESGTVQLARTYNKPVLVSGPPDLTAYVAERNLGWIGTSEHEIHNILSTYEKLDTEELQQLHSNIYDIAMENSWIKVAKKVLSFA
ncbi:MAG: hypothetical protein AAFZ89_04290 [Bacteroidota bacterium]